MTTPDTLALHTTRLSRRTLLASTLGMAVFTPAIVATAQSTTPESLATGDGDALTLLHDAIANLGSLESFTYALETTHGQSTIFPGVELISVKGAVRRPMDISATLDVKLLIQQMQISATVVNGEVFIQDPLSGGNWRSMGSAPEIVSMINPDWLIGAALSLVQNATITGTGSDTTTIEGTVDLAQQITTLGGGSDEVTMIADLLADTPIDVAFWIDDHGYLTRAEFYGAIFASESSDVERRITLSDFNEPVEIATPDI